MSLVDVIEQSINQISQFDLLSCDAEDVAAMVGAAGNAWVVGDVNRLERGLWIDSIEETKRKRLPGTHFTIYGTYDLAVTEEDGISRLIDWKTVGEINAITVERYSIFWQRKIYQWMTRVPRFTYRLVQKPAMACPVDNLAVRDIHFHVDDWETHDRAVETYLRFATQNFALYDGTSGPWLMNTAQCGAYGRDCFVKGSCPAHGHPAPLNRPELTFEINNSGINTLLLCPEKYRRTLLLGRDCDQTRDTTIGRAFHACMEFIYRNISLSAPQDGVVLAA